MQSFWNITILREAALEIPILLCPSVCQSVYDQVEIKSERNVQGTDITSYRNVQEMDIACERNVQGTEITSEGNVQGTEITSERNVDTGDRNYK